MKYRLYRNGKYTGIYLLGHAGDVALQQCILHLEKGVTSGKKKVIYSIKETKN